LKVPYLENPCNRFFSGGGVEGLGPKPSEVIDARHKVPLVLDELGNRFIDTRSGIDVRRALRRLSRQDFGAFAAE
jgi:hypothetical protein